MNPIVLALSPLVVALLTQGIKKLPKFKSLSDTWHKPVMRFMAALVAFVSAVFGGWISGNGIDPASIQVFAEAVVGFFGASGLFFLTKKK